MKTLREKLAWLLDLVPYFSIMLLIPLSVGAIFMKLVSYPIERRVILGIIISAIVFVLSIVRNTYAAEKKGTEESKKSCK